MAICMDDMADTSFNGNVPRNDDHYRVSRTRPAQVAGRVDQAQDLAAGHRIWRPAAQRFRRGGDRPDVHVGDHRRR
jgi:hypothetical protein